MHVVGEDRLNEYMDSLAHVPVLHASKSSLKKIGDKVVYEWTDLLVIMGAEMIQLVYILQAM
jgi:hypothetical protein